MTKSINRILTASICLLFIFPLAGALVNYQVISHVSGNVLCALYYACVALTFILYIGKNVFAHADLLWLLVFLATYGMVSMLSGEYNLVYNMVFMIPIYIFSYFAVQVRDALFRKLFMMFAISMMALTCATTIKTLIAYPDAARVLASNSFANYGLALYRSMGAGGFEFIYSVVVLIPICIVGIIANKNLDRIIATLLLIGGLFVVYLSGYTTAILLTSIAILLMGCSANKLVMWITVVFLPAIIALVLGYRMEIADIIYELAKNFEAQAVQNHLIELADIVAQRASVEDLDRAALYAKSAEAFFESPLWGTYASFGAVKVSGHSTLLDLLGGGGLLCFVPYIMFVIGWFRRNDSSFRARPVKMAWRVTTIVYLILQILNPIFANYLIIFSYMAVSVIVLQTCDENLRLL